MTRFVRFGLVRNALAVALFWAPMAFSQASQQAGSQSGATKATDDSTLVAIPASEVAGSASDAIARLRWIGSELDVDPMIARIESKLPAVVKNLQQLKEDPDTGVPERLRSRGLEEARQQWWRQQIYLDDWRKLLLRRSKTLEEEQEELRQMQLVWQLTYDSVATSVGSAALLETSQSVLQALNDLATKLVERLKVVLDVQSQVSQELSDISEILERIGAAQERARERLFIPDSSPLIQALFAEGESVSLREELSLSWARALALSRDFFEIYGARLPLHLLLFIAVLGLIIVLQWRSRRWEIEDDSLKASAYILRRPVSTALLMSLFATFWLYPRAPILIFELTELALLLPLLRLLPGLVDPRLRAPLYVLSILFSLEQLGVLTVNQPHLHRLALLMLTMLALAGFFWVVRATHSNSFASRGPWWRVLVIAAYVWLSSLLASVVANVLGNVGLAELLTDATLTSAYLAVLLFAFVLVLNGVSTVVLRTSAARMLNIIRYHGELLKRRLATLFRVGALLLWTMVTLGGLMLWDPLVGSLAAVFDESWSIGSLTISVGSIVAFVTTLVLAFLATRLVRFTLQQDVFPRLRLARGVPATISTLVHYLILVLGFVFALAAAGIELSKFALLAGGLGIGIGLGLQDLINNFVSGLILIFERPIQIGDVVEFGTLRGEVRRIGMRASTIQTFDGSEIIVPNGKLIASEVINWTLSDHQRRIELNVGVAYGTDPQKVLEILLKVASDHPEVLEDPEPIALFRSFGDSSLDFSLRFWTSSYKKWLPVSSDVHIAVNEALSEAAIVIPFPQRDLHLRTAVRTEPWAKEGNLPSNN